MDFWRIVGKKVEIYILRVDAHFGDIRMRQRNGEWFVYVKDEKRGILGNGCLTAITQVITLTMDALSSCAECVLKGWYYRAKCGKMSIERAKYPLKILHFFEMMTKKGGKRFSCASGCLDSLNETKLRFENGKQNSFTNRGYLVLVVKQGRYIRDTTHILRGGVIYEFQDRH